MAFFGCRIGDDLREFLGEFNCDCSIHRYAVGIAACVHLQYIKYHKTENAEETTIVFHRDTVSKTALTMENYIS